MKRIYLLSTFALMLCGVMIWSCSQEETENIGKVYRYSPEEISKLRSMAEEYNFPKEDLILESNMLLPSIDEYENIMLIARGINESFKKLEIIDYNSNSIQLNNINRFAVKRTLSSSMEYSGSYSETFRENFNNLNLPNSFAYLDLKISWNNVSPTDNSLKDVDVQLNMELSSTLYDESFEIEEFNYSWEFFGSRAIKITYTYKIVNRIYPQTVKFKQGYPNWLEINLE